jgi:hypothetical protein
MRENAPQSPPPLAALQSAEGLTKSVTALAGMYLVYRLASAVSEYVRDTKADNDEAERRRDRARKNFVETQIEQDKKDTLAIKRQIRESFAERERAKVRFRPKSVRGHWEGNVFVPYAGQPPKGKK